MTHSIVIAGFGGQGVLFAGRLIAYTAMSEGKNVTWFPSYGPEVRGGTCNCHVIISDKQIGNPIVSHADSALILNLQSLDKFEDKVKPGGNILIDGSIVKKELTRKDINGVIIPASDIAEEIGNRSLSGMVVLGEFARLTGAVGLENLIAAMKSHISASKAELAEINEKMLRANTKDTVGG